jgi:membrane protein implicated in regulation of membrane protease activity
MLPGTVLYVVGTDAIISGLTEGRIPWSLVIVILLAVMVLTFLVYWARKKLSGGRQTDSADNDKSK